MKESFFKFMLVTFLTFWATLGNSAEDDAKDLIEAIKGGSIQYKLHKLISEIPVNVMRTGALLLSDKALPNQFLATPVAITLIVINALVGSG